MENKPLENIRFTYNFNNKLQCLSFTTIRLSNRKYQVGAEYKIVLGNQYRPKTAVLIEKKTLLLSQLNEFIARVDVGCDLKQCIEIIKNLYKSNRGIDWKTQKLDFLLLSYTENAAFQTPKLFQ